MKFLVVLACVLAAASAQYYVPSTYGQAASRLGNPRITKVQTYTHTPAAPSGKVSIFSDEFKSIVTKGVDATNKAAEALNAMAPQLPALLKSVDPAMKSDIAKV